MQSKKAKWWLLAVFILGLLALGGYRGYRSYGKLQQELLLQQARDFLARSDFKSAALCLQRAVRHDDQDLNACRLMAELAERTDASVAVKWRQRVVQNNPGSMEDRLALVKTALMARDFTTASNALEKVDPIDRHTPAYQNEAGAFDVTQRRFAEAEAHFREASKMEPTNIAPQLNLAVLGLAGTNAAELQESRSFLRRLATNQANPLLRRKALLELTADARRHGQTNSALEFSQALLQQSNSILEDKILRLDILADSGDARLKKALKEAQLEAAGDPAKIYELASWQTRKTPPGDLLAWLQSLPAVTQTNRLVAMSMAETYCNAGDWRGLQTFLQPQQWADFEFVRFAFQALALGRQQLTGAAKDKWAEALKLAGNRKQSLVLLVELAGKWQSANEEEALLRDILREHPNEKWAFQELTQVLFANGQTWPLLELLGKASEKDPSDLSLKNNLAWVALLAEAEGWKPHELAREVYQNSPTNSHYASTYAFSLHLQAKDAEALKILEKLNAAELENPSLAGGYGLVLQATGNRAKARKYLDIASKAPMLPEQRKLIEKAAAAL